MGKFGDLFPGDPKDLDELLEQLAQRMAAASAMLASMTPRTAGPAAVAHERAARRHGSLLAGQSAGGQPPSGLPGRAVGPAHVVQRRRGTRHGRDDGHVPAPRRPRPARADAVGGSPAGRARRDRPRPGQGARRPGRLRVAGGARRSWRGASRRPASSSSGRAGSSSRRKDFGESASGRWRTCSSTSRKDRLGGHGLVRMGVGHERADATKPYELRRPVQPAHRTDDAQRDQAAGGRGRARPRRLGGRLSARPAESALACRVGPARVGPACSSRFGSARKTSRSSGPST